MKHTSLTTRYRPQTFAEVAGQATLKSILSRAAQEDKVAPAYLFSGTRGVGKTTLARIFAKTLNCRTAPAAEPCNQCDQCRAVTGGMSVDVVEIDGASNRGIDDVRRLKESVGYAPMESRYKIFIIDEAHMLSREAFNALLKTLEEPPARVTFIMATTEPHKFPATIISRCQHFVFKRLSDAELEAHLKGVLDKENTPYEENALRLLIRRAAGSARDAMSLLGQVLALSGDKLREEDLRSVLGLAGQELFFRLLEAVRQGDCAPLSTLVREMLDQGLDLGFFLRELAATWRNLFMLRQMGANGIPLVDLPASEAGRWLELAEKLDLSHIHACWQLSLEGQRRVLTSLEPAMALELLLFNLALFPRLFSVEQLSRAGRKTGAGEAAAEKKTILSGAERPGCTERPGGTAPEKLQEGPKAANPGSSGKPDHKHQAAHAPGASVPVWEDNAAAAPGPESDLAGGWPEFAVFCAGREAMPPGLPSAIRDLKAEFDGQKLTLTPRDKFAAEHLSENGNMDRLSGLLQEFYGKKIDFLVLSPPKFDRDKLAGELKALPVVKALMEEMEAEFVDYWHK